MIEGKLRGLAVTSKARSQALPGVPTTAEAGYPAVAGDNWQGIVVPSGTPKAAIDFVHREMVEILAARRQRAAGGARLRAGRQHAGRVRPARQNRV